MQVPSPSQTTTLTFPLNLFTFIFNYLGQKSQLSSADSLLIDFLGITLNPPAGFTCSLSHGNLIDFIEEQLWDNSPQTFTSLARISRVFGPALIKRFCNEPLETIKGLLESTADLEAPIYSEILTLIHTIHLNPTAERAILRLGIHLILYDLVKKPYQEDPGNLYSIPRVQQNRRLALQILLDCLAKKDEASLMSFMSKMLNKDLNETKETLRASFIQDVILPLMKMKTLGNLIPVSIDIKPLEGEKPEGDLYDSNYPRLQKEARQKIQPIDQLSTQQYKDLLTSIFKGKEHRQAMDHQWRKVEGSWEDLSQAQCMLIIVTCSAIGNKLTKFGAYIASGFKSEGQSVHSLAPENNFFFEINEKNELSVLSNDITLCLRTNQQDPRKLSLEFGKKDFWNSYSYLEISPEKNTFRFDISSAPWPIQPLLISVKDHQNFSLNLWTGFPYLNTTKLAQNSTPNLTPQLIQTALQSPQNLYLIPKNLTLKQFLTTLIPHQDTLKNLLVHSHKGDSLISQIFPHSKEDQINTLTINSNTNPEAMKKLFSSPFHLLESLWACYPDSFEGPLFYLLKSLANCNKLFSSGGVQPPSAFVMMRYEVFLGLLGVSSKTADSLFRKNLFFELLLYFLTNTPIEKDLPLLCMTFLANIDTSSLSNIEPKELWILLGKLCHILFETQEKTLQQSLAFSQANYDKLSEMLSQAQNSHNYDSKLTQKIVDSILWQGNPAPLPAIPILNQQEGGDLKAYLAQIKQNWVQVLALVDPKDLNASSYQDKYTLYQLSKGDHDKSELMDIFVIPFIALKTYNRISKSPALRKSLEERSGLSLTSLVGEIIVFLVNFGQGQALEDLENDQYYLLRLQNLHHTKVINIPKTLMKVLMLYGSPQKENGQLIPVLSKRT